MSEFDKFYGGIAGMYVENPPYCKPEVPFKEGEKIFFVSLNSIRPALYAGWVRSVETFSDKSQFLDVYSCEERIHIVSTLCSRNPRVALARARHAVNGALDKLNLDLESFIKY